MYKRTRITQMSQWVFAAVILLEMVLGCTTDADTDTNTVSGDSDSETIEDCVPRWPDDDCTRCLVFVNGETGSDDSENSSAGRSWETAFKTVQKGIDAAAESGCEVWVTATDAGYVEDLNLIGSPALYGGFSGNETHRNQRDSLDNKTVLTPAGYWSNVISCKAEDGCENNVVLDGFVITGGSGGYSPGGGMYLKDGSATLSNCTFQGNYAEEQGGGGIYLNNSTLNIDNCTFTHNSAWAAKGGAIWAELSSVTITRSTFANNAAQSGGAIYSGTSSTVTVKDTTFQENMVWDGAVYGGAVYNAGDYQLFERCEFIDNSASMGGAVYNLQTSTTVIGSTFLGNSAKYTEFRSDDTYLIGGGIYNDESSALIIDCTFSDNSVEPGDNTVFAEGGGIYNNAGSEIDIIGCIFDNNNSSGIADKDAEPFVTDCLFTNHDTAIINRGSSPHIVGCTFFANEQAIFNSNSASDQSFPIISNSIFWGNETPITDDANSTSKSESTVTYCDVEGGLEGEGNIDADPLFEADSFMLREGSPCINAGNTEALPADVADLDDDDNVEEAIPYDLNGTARINGDAPDMGAYEF